MGHITPHWSWLVTWPDERDPGIKDGTMTAGNTAWLSEKGTGDGAKL
jgi:hypothetical protein